MPCKNTRKIYSEDSYYHVYNRGFDRRQIFHDSQDYNTFIYFLRTYLEPGFTVKKFDKAKKVYVEYTPAHCYKKVSLKAFCLMPNHFHLLVRLLQKEGMSELLKKVCLNYTSYYNSKYDREGKLYNGVYRAVLVNNEPQFKQLTRYIHLNPVKLLDSKPLEGYEFSSFNYIFSDIKKPWIDWKAVLLDNTRENYINFVKCKEKDGFGDKDREEIASLVLD